MRLCLTRLHGLLCLEGGSALSPRGLQLLVERVDPVQSPPPAHFPPRGLELPASTVQAGDPTHLKIFSTHLWCLDVPSVFREGIVPGLPLRRMILACVAEASTPSQAGLSNTQSLVCLSLPPFTPPEFLLCKSFQVCVLCCLKFILRKFCLKFILRKFWQEVSCLSVLRPVHIYRTAKQFLLNIHTHTE